MKKIINILVVLGILIVSVLGIKNMFFPADTLELYGIDLKGPLIHNTFRGAISGTLLGVGLMLLMGLLSKNKTWYQSTLLLLSVIIFGRIYSIFAVGWSDALIAPMVVEVFLVIVLYFASLHTDPPRNKNNE